MVEISAGGGAWTPRPPPIAVYRVRCKHCGQIIERINVYDRRHGPGSWTFNFSAYDAQEDHRWKCEQKAKWTPRPGLPEPLPDPKPTCRPEDTPVLIFDDQTVTTVRIKKPRKRKKG